MTDGPNDRSVFVVHGRNDALRRAMFDFLRSISLVPMEWADAIALTRKGSPYIGEILDAAFANAVAIVVLMTPDEVAYLQSAHGSGDDDPETLPAPQARPNVLFEAGMALGRNADRTVLVEVGTVRPFSDVAGRHAVRLGNDLASRQALASRLEVAGAAVNVTGTDWHDAGDFTPPPPPGGGLPLGRRVPSSSGSRSPISIALDYVSRGGSRIDKLRVINRGSEVAYQVELDVPSDAALSILEPKVIEKIPGNGGTVTIDVMNYARMFSSDKAVTFDVRVKAQDDAGQPYETEIFMDMNG